MHHLRLHREAGLRLCPRAGERSQDTRRRGFGLDGANQLPQCRHANPPDGPKRIQAQSSPGFWRWQGASRIVSRLNSRTRSARIVASLFPSDAGSRGASHAHLRRCRSSFPVPSAPAAAREPDLIFKKSTTFKLLTLNDKLATYGDRRSGGRRRRLPLHRAGTRRRRQGWLGVAEEVSTSRSPAGRSGRSPSRRSSSRATWCSAERRSLFFKKMQIVRGCDVKRNVLVYVVYSDKLVEGSPKNSTSTVPIMPWGAATEVAKCADWVE